MVLHKKGKKTLTRVAGRWGALQEVLRGDKQRAESSEGERQSCVFHMHVQWEGCIGVSLVTLDWGLRQRQGRTG